MNAQIPDFENDLLDTQLRHVEKDIRLCRRLPPRPCLAE
jgi:hypothetical protein